METAGVQEKNHAIELGNICEDGIPWVTVYLDGSWSKRSYGHNYNALSGMVSTYLLTIEYVHRDVHVGEKLRAADMQRE